MKVENAPPASRGVTTLMHVGEEPGESSTKAQLHEYATYAGWGIFAVWLYAHVTDKPTLGRWALGGSIAAALVQFATK